MKKMTNYWRLVNNVIDRSDILLLVLDSRFPFETRNKEIEKKIEKKGKKIIYVLNKCDLVSKDYIESIKRKFSPCLFVSSKKNLGGTLLFKKIMQMSHGQEPVVGVLGYPNVGKSSVINLLKGRKSASVSSVSGHTKGLQIVKAKGKIKLFDTPGVLSFKDDDILKKVVIGSVNPHKIKEPEIYAIELINMYPNMIGKYYGVDISEENFDAIDKISLHKKILKKGGEPDTQRMSKQVLYDWQKGKIHERFIEEEYGVTNKNN